MKVRPQDHQWQQPQRGRLLAVGRAHQSRHPRDHHREGESVRPRHDVRCGEEKGSNGEQQCLGWPKFSEEVARQQGEGQGNGGGSQHHHARPADEGVSAGIEDLREPLLGDPRRAREREGKGIAGGEGAMLDDPAADNDVPIAVRVVEQLVADQEHDEVEDAADGQR